MLFLQIHNSFRHRGFGNDYAKGYAEAKIALPKIKKPKFYWRNLPNYLWCEGSMIVGLFRYLVYRVQRALKITWKITEAIE